MNVLISGVPHIHDLAHQWVVNNERVWNFVEHWLKNLAVFFLGLEEMGPGAIRVVLVKQLVALVWDSVGQGDAGDHSPVLVTAEPVAELIPEGTKRPGHLRRCFLPQRRDQEFDPRVWCRLELPPINGAGVRDGELDIKERTLSLVGSSGSRAGFDERLRESIWVTVSRPLSYHSSSQRYHLGYHRTLWQRCQFHLMQNAMQYVPKVHLRKQVADEIRNIFNARDLDDAMKELKRFVTTHEKTAPKLASWAEENIPEGLTVFTIPAGHRKRMRTTNMLERQNKELKRRTRVAGLFPNEESLLRLVTAVLVELSDDWETGMKYLTI